MKAPIYTLLTVLLLAGCGPSMQDQATPAKGPTLKLTVDEVALLAFVNDLELTDAETLDVDCSIRSDTAQLIMEHRNGNDTLAGTWDDNPIDTVAELNGIYGVGRDTLNKLFHCATDFGYGPSMPELDMLQLLNDQGFTGLETLDIDCGLHADAARNLLAHRDGPDGEAGTADDNLFHSLEEVDNVPQMGIWNVNKLMACPDRLSTNVETDAL